MIELVDNNSHNSVPANLSENDWRNLRKISGKTISELVKENRNLFVFPPNLDNDIGKQTIFTFTGTQNSAKIEIKTDNIMGFIGVAGTQIDIRSRFAADGNDFFLHYLIQKSLGLNLLKYEHSSARERILDFLIYLFPSYLNAALTQGIYREYQTFERNDANVRGVIDIARHIAKNLPFAGKIAYRSRERNFDNKITELVRHTIEFLRSREEFHEIFNAAGTCENIEKILAATPNYNLRERQKILHQNLKPLRAPYFSKYVPLQKLCRMILLRETMNYGAENDEIFGVIFDIAWLWEEYLWTLLREHFGEQLKHPQNRAGTGCVKPFLDSKIGTFYPDFYIRGNAVFDAKYKPFEENEDDNTRRNPKARDLSQMISYMHILACSRGEFLYPAKSGGNENSRQLGTLRGNDKNWTIAVRALQIPQDARTFRDFCGQIRKNEEEFLSHEFGGNS